MKAKYQKGGAPKSVRKKIKKKQTGGYETRGGAYRTKEKRGMAEGSDYNIDQAIAFADLNPSKYYEYKDGKKTIRYKDGDTYTQPPAGTTSTLNKRDNTLSSEMPEPTKVKKARNQFPIDRRKGGKRYQKGGKVKSSLQYKPGFPATGNKPSPYDLKTLKKAIKRDSTKVADRSFIGDFLDPGVTSGSTGPSDQYNLQINREFRDKKTGSSSKQTAKKINTMTNKKQKGGDLKVNKQFSQVRNKAKGKMAGPKGPTPPPITGQETKDAGKRVIKAGRKLKREGRKNDDNFDKIYGQDLVDMGKRHRKKGRKMKRDERSSTMNKGGYMEPSKEIKFGGPTKKMQKGGKTRKPDRKTVLKNRIKSGNREFDESMKKKIAEERGVRTREKRKGMQKGGLKTPTAKQKGLKKLPTSVRNKMGFKMMGGKMKYGMGGKKDKKFLGGMMGAIGGMKGAQGGFGKKLLGAAKGALGGGMLGRGIGAIKGAMGGGGLQGAMQGLAGGAFGNSNPMGQQGAMDPNAAQDPNAAVAQKGGLRDRRKAAKKRMKKSKASARKSAKKIN